MHSSFRHLLRVGCKSAAPLLSLAFLNLYKKDIYNSVQQSIQGSQKTTNINQTATKLSQRHQGWDWDRIIQIHTPEQLSHNDVLQKTIICYQMTGNIQIDSQVALLSHLFCDKFFGKISERFQFVFLTPNPKTQVDGQIFYMVFSKQGSKFVPMKKYINTKSSGGRFLPNYSPLFNRLLEQVNMYHELSLTNINEHLQHLGSEGRDTYQLVVIPQDDSQVQINNSKRVMERFLKNRQIWNSQIVKSIITDKATRTILGLNRQGIEANKVYLISPNNKNLLRTPQSTFKVESKTYTIIPSDQLQSQFIFPPIPPKLSPQSYILKFNVDLNQTKPQLVDGIYEMMRDQKLLAQLDGLRVPRLLTFSKGQESIQITIEKNNHDTIIHAYEQGCMYEGKYKRDLLSQTNLWKYPHQTLDPHKLSEFVSAVVKAPQDLQAEKRKQSYQCFKSESQAESSRKSSKLIAGEQRRNVINRKQDKIIFHYSKSCHSCKRFGGVYEEIAKDLQSVKFYRVDNDTNKAQGLRNYNSTPVFVMYKNNYPTLPWYFKMTYFTKTLFTNFVQITKQLNVIDSKVLKNHISQHVQNQNLVKQTLKQVL